MASTKHACTEPRRRVAFADDIAPEDHGPTNPELDQIPVAAEQNTASAQDDVPTVSGQITASEQDTSNKQDASSEHGTASQQAAAFEPNDQGVTSPTQDFPSVNDLAQELAYVNGQGRAATTPQEIKRLYFEYIRVQEELKLAKVREGIKPRRKRTSRRSKRNKARHSAGSPIEEKDPKDVPLPDEQEDKEQDPTVESA